MFLSGKRVANVTVTASLEIADIEGNDSSACGHIEGEAERLDNVITCFVPILARYVQLQLEQEGMINIHEVEVRGI